MRTTVATDLSEERGHRIGTDCGAHSPAGILVGVLVGRRKGGGGPQKQGSSDEAELQLLRMTPNDRPHAPVAPFGSALVPAPPPPLREQH